MLPLHMPHWSCANPTAGAAQMLATHPIPLSTAPNSPPQEESQPAPAPGSGSPPPPPPGATPAGGDVPQPPATLGPQNFRSITRRDAAAFVRAVRRYGLINRSVGADRRGGVPVRSAGMVTGEASVQGNSCQVPCGH